VTRPNEKEFFRLDEKDFRLPAYTSPAHDQGKPAVLALMHGLFLAWQARTPRHCGASRPWLWKSFEGKRLDDA
jgi:hypothetical protein